MPNNLCIIEDIEDFKLFKKKNLNNNDCIFAPLNLETFIECKKQKLNIIDFHKYLKNNFHKTALFESKKFLNKIRFKKKIEYSLKSEILSSLRFRFNSLIFLIEVINQAIKDLGLKKLIISGISKSTQSLHGKNNKIVNDVVRNLYESITVPLISHNKNSQQIPELFEYSSSTTMERKNLKILISNKEYNFSKLSKKFNERKIECWMPLFNKISFLKKIYYKFYLKINLIIFKKNLKITKQRLNFIEPITFLYKKKKDISKIMNLFYKKLEFNFNDTNEKINSLKKFIKKNHFNLTISNIVRGLDGSILDKDLKLKSICISHGIICKSFNKIDEIYKKNIAEAVFNGDSKFFSIQSKIMHDSLETHKILGKKVITGNMVFARRKNEINKKKYILFASTVKDFYNLQFLGVEMFYEFWNTLKDLNEASKKLNEQIIVKLHPTIRINLKELKKIFKNLTFSHSKIESLLKDAIALISYSSSTIEDSLNSAVPIILYDPHVRYEHIRAKEPNSGNEPIFYIKDKEKLFAIIKKIKNIKKFNFNNYIYEKNFDESFKKNILTLLN